MATVLGEQTARGRSCSEYPHQPPCSGPNTDSLDKALEPFTPSIVYLPNKSEEA